VTGLSTVGGLMQDSLEPHFQNVVRATFEGSLIPLLGAGVNMSGRPPEKEWEPGRFDCLPSTDELAGHLASYFGYPTRNGDAEEDLVRVAQYVAVISGSGPLYRRLHLVFDGNYEPSPVHRLFARLPPLLRERGIPHQLIVTTNYDDAMERALRDEGEKFDVVSYIADGEARGKFHHFRPDGKVVVIETPNRYGEHGEISLEERTVVLKIHGAVDRPSGERDSFVITEDHYIDYLTRTDISELVPARLTARLLHSSFLFLGYSMRDWNLRVILHRIWGQQRLSWKSWAVQLDPEKIERQFWAMRDVEILDHDLDDYVRTLAGRFGVPTAARDKAGQ
jgi:SIR2-like domain